MKINDDFIDSVKNNFKKYDDLAILLAYGDFNYNPDIFSNLFVIFYSEKDDHIEKIELFKNLVHNYFDVKYEILEEKQSSFYTKNSLKIDFKIKKPFTIEKDKEILEKRGINWDKSVLVRKNYETQNIKSNFINNFIKNYDDFYTHFYLGDFIKAYKNFNELLYTLFDMKGIYDSTEQSKIWYSSNHPARKDLEILVNLSSNLNPNKMMKKTKKLSEIFIKFLNEKDQDYKKVKSVLLSINKKYPYFFNLRDISKIANNDSEKVILNEGLVYRSASLERYKEEDIEEFMKNNDITKIVDLRDEEELALYKEKRNTFYSDDFKKKYVINIPISNFSVNKIFRNNIIKNGFDEFLNTQKKSIKVLFENHFNNADKDRMIIHCESGKDRTGLIIAILLDFLGVEKRVIKKDFMSSYQDSSEILIDMLIDTINQKYGGSENYLRDYCSVSQDILNSVRKKFVLVQKAY
ncbi:tyrosine-protein phosphatase [Geotoga petraea]|uniref:Tyrosine-protein phosphatase n=1 Tax=Geotoga petraea TaxID=28234 RepID=A0A4Z0VXS5_9BACT|nr:tyrosine-protein phosphatase [Geotoga petraea]MDK2946790.1 protein-tyrosine phosphatase [Geotoga sp.]TGG88801.1 tyrosine-protein phosphatase [Geotoga petraea]